MARGEVCTTEGCTDKQFGKGLCGKCLRKAKKERQNALQEQGEEGVRKEESPKETATQEAVAALSAPLGRRQRVRLTGCSGYDIDGLYGEVMKGPENKGVNECYLVAVENTGTVWVRSTHIIPIERIAPAKFLPVQPFPPLSSAWKGD